jgi:hypothetical protein
MLFLLATNDTHRAVDAVTNHREIIVMVLVLLLPIEKVEWYRSGYW